MIEVRKDGSVKKACSYEHCTNPDAEVVVSTPTRLTKDGEVIQRGMTHYHAECAARVIYELRYPTTCEKEQHGGSEPDADRGHLDCPSGDSQANEDTECDDI